MHAAYIQSTKVMHINDNVSFRSIVGSNTVGGEGCEQNSWLTVSGSIGKRGRGVYLMRGTWLAGGYASSRVCRLSAGELSCVLGTLREQHRVWDNGDFWVLNVDSGQWRSHISFSVSWTLHCRRCSVEYWAILNVWTSLYIGIHTDTTVDVPTNETLLPRRPETSCWQRHSGHLPTRIRGTVTTRGEWVSRVLRPTRGRWEKGVGVYCIVAAVGFVDWCSNRNRRRRKSSSPKYLTSVDDSWSLHGQIIRQVYCDFIASANVLVLL